MAKKKPTKDNSLKKRIITISISVVVFIAVAYGTLYVYSVRLIDYYGTKVRCGNGHQVIVGMKGMFGLRDFYFPVGDDHNAGPSVGGKYFCSNKEAEDAGYQVYTDLRIRD